MEDWLRVQTIVDNYCVCERTVRKWIKENGLRNTKINGCVFIKKKWLDEFFLDHERHEQNNDDLLDELTSNL